MRAMTLPLLSALLLAGCMVPVQSTGSSDAPDEVSLGSVGGVAVLRGGDRIKPGSQSLDPISKAGVVSAGGGNVVSAGGGNVAGNPAPETAPLIGGAGGNVISAGGGNLTMSDDLALTQRLGRDPIPGAFGCEEPEPSDLTGTVAGSLLAPAELTGAASGTVPVTGAPVGLYELDGTLLAETVSSGEAGAFTFAAAPRERALVARSLVRVGDRTVYLASLVQLEAATVTLTLDPVSTLMEAKYLLATGGKVPSRGHFAWSRWLAVRDMVVAASPTIPLEVLSAGTPIADRAKIYDALAIKGGIDSWSFDCSAADARESDEP